jgi:hypothetical protein
MQTDGTRPRAVYRGLRAGQPGRLGSDASSLIVKPQIASVQLEADRVPRDDPAGEGRTSTNGGTKEVVSPPAGGTGGSGGTTVGLLPLRGSLRRFHGSVELDPIRIGNDASKIGVEILSNLAGIVGAEVQVTLDIQAVLPDGASEKLIRDVTENCRTLRFKEHGFEEL